MLQEFTDVVKIARDAQVNYIDTTLASLGLSIEVGELNDLILKKYRYNTNYTTEDITSEAGDVLYYLTLILIDHNVSLEQVIISNKNKLTNRGWV